MGWTHGTTWTDELIERSIRQIIDATGEFPSNSTLLSMGRGDLSNAIARNGGFVHWCERMECERSSASDFGWAGEKAFSELCGVVGLSVEKPSGVKCPYDLLLAGVLRADVKTARFAEYGPCRGWFYRVGKHAQADLIVLYQFDTKDFYALPWWVCPKSNITVSRGGGMYVAYRNNWRLIDRMIGMRQVERSIVLGVVEEVA